MFDFKKLDVFFAEDSLKKKGRENDRNIVRRTRAVRLVKLLLPAVAAALAGLLIVLPGLQDRSGDLQLNIAKPKDGELEKLHMENTVFTLPTTPTGLTTLPPTPSTKPNRVQS